MIEDIKKLKISYEEDVDLTKYNTMKLNSFCYLMVHPKTVQELKSIFSIAKEYKTKFIVLGNGSNIILPDYYDGIVIKLDKFKKMIFNNGSIYVESGYMLNKLANKISSLGYTGLEWATGIPGTIGGAIYSNAGAYNSSISDIIKNVIVFDKDKIVELDNKDLEFGYRTSIFRDNPDLIVLSCNLKLNRGNITDIKNLIKTRTLKRMQTQPLDYPSCGSVFRNPENAPAGKLIEDANLKGYKIGGAKISEKHANFIVNDGNATSKDIISLIKYIKKEIKKKYNIDLVLEQEIIK